MTEVIEAQRVGTARSAQAQGIGTQLMRSVEWLERATALRIIDQRELPAKLVHQDLSSLDEVIDAVKTLAIRGANSIGAAGAFGFALGIKAGLDSREAARAMIGARPTAVTLKHGVEEALAAFENTLSWEAAVESGQQIIAQDQRNCELIGEFGAQELEDAHSILTHCNTGILATAGIGTALGVVYTLAARDNALKVYSTETRPLRQGLRLTTWELSQAGIDVTALVDSAAASLLASGAVDAVIVGADRIAVNGDTANKVGTFALALAAAAAGVPFYVAAPLSAIDAEASSARDIPIEMRGSAEVLDAAGVNQDLPTWNPAFDIAPANLIKGIVTERGVLRAPFETSIAQALHGGI